MNIYDVAKQTKLSIATVSRVLNNKGNVAEPTRQKVLKAINELNYLPNALAVGLSKNNPRTISIIVRNVSNIHSGLAVSYLEDNLSKLGYNILLFCTGDSVEKESYIRESISKKVDAIILVGSYFTEAAENSRMELYASNTPTILINGETNIDNAYCVSCDEYTGVKSLVSEYAAAGKKRILYVYDVITYSSKNKLRGYQDGLAHAKLIPDEDLIIKSERDLKGAFGAVKSVLDKKIDFDSVICSEDILAAGAVKAIIGSGKNVPSDIVISGINNSIISDCCIPEITSIDNKITELCALAVSSLQKLFNKETVPKKQVILPVLVRKKTF